MVDILSALHKYVPSDPSTEDVEVPGCDVPIELRKSNFFNIGLGEFALATVSVMV